jgi:predicted acylesterase/phospholipase RssA
VLDEARQATLDVMKRVKSEQDEHAAGRRPDPPVVDVLIISGGGDWGAFGAGFLKGWKRIPKNDPLAMPAEFDVVTGVSTGALIAPFAFVGTDEALERIDRLYRNPKKDWVKQRWPLYFLPNNLSFAEVPGLERELREQVSPEMVRQIAERGHGRLLAVNTTNLDDATPHAFNLITEARRATESGDMTRLHNIMLASAGIPGAFPYREIDGEMYVDGGVTSNIMYGGRITEEETFAAVWARQFPDVPVPKTRTWVIFNNQLRTTPTTVNARWMDIITRSLELATRSATLTRDATPARQSGSRAAQAQG